MYDSERNAVRSGNMFTLTLATPVATGGKEPGDYDGLENKPSINGVVLSGNLTLEDLGIPDLSNVPTEPLSNEDLDEILDT